MLESKLNTLKELVMNEIYSMHLEDPNLWTSFSTDKSFILITVSWLENNERIMIDAKIPTRQFVSYTYRNLKMLAHLIKLRIEQKRATTINLDKTVGGYET